MIAGVSFIFLHVTISPYPLLLTYKRLLISTSSKNGYIDQSIEHKKFTMMHQTSLVLQYYALKHIDNAQHLQVKYHLLLPIPLKLA